MLSRKKNNLIRITAILLVLAMLVPVGASAAVVETVEPRASDYLNSYNAYVYPAGNGKIQVWFSVFGVDTMDELGTLRIGIYESTDNVNWTWKKTFTNDSTAGMLAYDVIFHAGHVDYQGVAGRYYKAYVCVWGGKNGQGNTRYFYTSAKLAT